MQSLQAHAPEMKEIQKKYKGDRQKLNEELMKFYRENNINPAASCLPLLAQLPVFFALFFVLKDFSKHPPPAPTSAGCTSSRHRRHRRTSHWSGYLLLAIYAGSQVRLDVLHVDDDGQDAARRSCWSLPLVFIRVVAHFPAGLVLYWVTTNLWTVGQGLDHAAARAEDARSARRRPPAPKRSLADAGRKDEQRQRPQPPRAEPAPKPQPQQPRRVKRKKGGARR